MKIVSIFYWKKTYEFESHLFDLLDNMAPLIYYYMRLNKHSYPSFFMMTKP